MVLGLILGPVFPFPLGVGNSVFATTEFWIPSSKKVTLSRGKITERAYWTILKFARGVIFSVPHNLILIQSLFLVVLAG